MAVASKRSQNRFGLPFVPIPDGPLYRKTVPTTIIMPGHELYRRLAARATRLTVAAGQRLPESRQVCRYSRFITRPDQSILESKEARHASSTQGDRWS